MRMQKHFLMALVLFSCTTFAVAQQNKSFTSVAAASDYAPETWKPYSSTEGRFKVLFPGEPKETSETVDAVVGGVRFHKVAYDSFISYSVVYFDGPTDLENSSHVEDILDTVRDSGLAQVESEDPQVVKESELLVDGHPGRLLHVVLKGDGVIRMKSVVFGSRMFVVTVGTPKGQPNVPGTENGYEAIAMSFLNSFGLIETKNPNSLAHYALVAKANAFETSQLVGEVLPTIFDPRKLSN